MPETSHLTTSGAVPADYVRLLFHYLERQGIDAAALLRQAAPSASAPPVGAAHWRHMLATAARHLSDPALGLHVGSTITPADLGPLGYVLLSSASAAAALERYLRYQRLVHDVSPVRHYLENGALVLEWSEESRRVGLLVNQCGMAALAAFARHCTGASAAEAAVPLAVHFVEAAPDDTAPYTQALGCPVLFGQSATRMLFDASILALPMRRADSALAAMLERQVEALMAALPAALPGQPGQFARSVKASTFNAGGPQAAMRSAMAARVPASGQVGVEADIDPGIDAIGPAGEGSGAPAGMAAGLPAGGRVTSAPSAAVAPVASSAPGTPDATACPPQPELPHQVRRLLPAHILQGEAALDAVAAALNMSSRTLRRRLQEQGCHFRALLEDTRRQLALGYLADRRLALAEVALLLGYSEQSAFNRAALRWTGMTPRAWRAQLLAACGGGAPARTSAG